MDTRKHFTISATTLHEYELQRLCNPNAEARVIRENMRKIQSTAKVISYDSIITTEMVNLSVQRFAQLIRTSPGKVSQMDLSLVNTYAKVRVSELSLLKVSLMQQRTENCIRHGMLWSVPTGAAVQRSQYKRIYSSSKDTTRYCFGLTTMSRVLRHLKQQLVSYHLVRFPSSV